MDNPNPTTQSQGCCECWIEEDPEPSDYSKLTVTERRHFVDYDQFHLIWTVRKWSTICSYNWAWRYISKLSE